MSCYYGSRLAAAAADNTKRKQRLVTAANDRFIPSRAAMDLDISRMALQYKPAAKENTVQTAAVDVPPQTCNAPHFNYKNCLQSSILHTNSPQRTVVAPHQNSSRQRTAMAPTSRILAFSDRNAAPSEFVASANKSFKRRAPSRYIGTKPVKILDAPNIQEDFYLNLLDWGSTGALAVALHDSVYLWNSQSGSIERLCETDVDGDYVTSVQWSADGRYVAVGSASRCVQLWDATRIKKVRQWSPHSDRIGALAWNGWTLTTGGRDAKIVHNDVRMRCAPYSALTAHEEEICGLRWNSNGLQLASGGNDNLVCVWDAGASTAATARPRLRLTAHKAAVKALAWCPHQTNLLATGGGTADRSLRFWNTASGNCVKSVDTMSQVSGIQWSPSAMELVTSHGFSQNQLTVWKYSSMTRMAELKGHTSRVLQLGLSPDGTTVVSGGADETLRFWKVFESNSARRAARASVTSKNSLLSHHRLVLR